MKKIKSIAFVAAFAAIAGYGVFVNQKTDEMSELTLANIEALAQHWESGNQSGWWPGYVASTYMYYIPPFGSVSGGITDIPCCKYNGNYYNVCTAVDLCP